MNNPLVHIGLNGGGGGGGAVTSVNGQVGDVDLTAADVGAASASSVLRYINLTSTSALTGTTVITLVRSQLIPANTFSVGKVFRVRSRTIKTGVNATYGAFFYINTISDLTGASFLASFGTATAPIRSAQVKRDFFIKSATNTESFFVTTGLITDDTSVINALSATNINWTIDQYFIFALSLTSAADSVLQSGYYIELL